MYFSPTKGVSNRCQSDDLDLKVITAFQILKNDNCLVCTSTIIVISRVDLCMAYCDNAQAHVDDLDLDAMSRTVPWQRKKFSVKLSRQLSICSVKIITLHMTLTFENVSRT